MIFNIQRFSTHDGEGIRTIIFFKGCPLHCRWCSNPEGQSYGYSVFYDPGRCRNFGDCIAAEPAAIRKNGTHGVKITREKIHDTLKLRDICAAKAITVSGENKSTEELLDEIRKDIPFYLDNGGVTLSGGEPLSHESVPASLLPALKALNISVNVETSLHVPWTMIKQCLGYVDTFLVDLKHTDKEKFEMYTGGEVSRVQENLVRLVAQHGKVVIRIPVIPGFNHTEAEMKQMIDFVLSLKRVREIHFLPYHTLGVEKYRMLGMEYTFGQNKPVRDDELTPYIDYAQSAGLQTKIGG